MSTAVMVLKTSTDKASLEELAFESSQLTALAIQDSIKLVDCVITFQGCKDILKQLKRIDRKRRFDYVIIYSPHQIAKNAGEYNAFVQVCRDAYQAEVKYFRA